MDWKTEILKLLASAGLGGGAFWVFNFRRRLRRDRNAMNFDDFEVVSKMANKAMEDIAAMSDRIGQLEKEKIAIYKEISQLKRENESLRKENAHLEEVLREYIKEKNPNIVK